MTEYNLHIFIGFPRFWYDSNAWSGMIESLEDLYEMFNTKMSIGSLNETQILDLSRNTNNEKLTNGRPFYNFGLRDGYNGTKTLREYLREHGHEFKNF